MMKTVIWLIALFYGVMGGLYAGVVPLPDIVRPHYMAVDATQFYICEHEEISIYSLKDFKRIKKFGKKGEGPQEFMSSATVNCQSDILVVDSAGKLSIYSRSGEFRKEIRSPSILIKGFAPAGNDYIALEYNFGDRNKVVKCNPQLEKIKEIFVEEIPRKLGRVFDGALQFRVYNDKVYIASGKDFVIRVFDFSGKSLYSIKQEYKRLAFTHEHAKQFLEAYRTSPVTKDFYENFKKRAEFPEYFPAIDSFFVANGRVYVQTHRIVDKKSEFFIFDESGKYLKTLYLPVVDKDFMTPSIFDIQSGRLYNLVENEETEEWELHITEID